jgi:N-ethylmaleimide reductase
MKKARLFEPIKVGPIELKNRVVMAPMTRNRAENEHEAPTDIHAKYYSQRASAGLILTEGSPVSAAARGYIATAGIYNDVQEAGWKNVNKAVHENGGHIQVQLWHVGRVSHPFFHNGDKPPAPSAIKADAMSFTPDGFQPTPEPRAMTKDEIKSTVEDFRKAASRAKRAGFDGAQIHGANGYLVEQFLHSSANQRTDEYGGSIENRARFLFEVIDAVAGEIGENRTSLRLSPSNLFNTKNDPDSKKLYEYVVEKLNTYDLSYLELVEPLGDLSDHPHLIPNVAEHFRPIYNGILMSNGNFDRDDSINLVENGTADLVSFARLFLANPDLPKRLEMNAELNEPDSDTFYGGGAEGYTDYPFLENMSA